MGAPNRSLRLEETIKRLRAEGWTQAAIAVELGVTQGLVSVILRRNGLGGYLNPAKRVRGKR